MGPSETYITLPQYKTPEACKSAGGIPSTDPAANTVTCDMSAATSRPSWLFFGLSVAAAVAAGAAAMHVAMKKGWH